MSAGSIFAAALGKATGPSLRCEMALFQGFLYAVGMLKNRHVRTDLFAMVPQLGLRFEPLLEQLDRLLDDDDILGRVRDS